MRKISTKALFRRATADDLQDLVEYVTKPVTGILDQTDEYKEHFPDHTKYAKEILKEIKAFGGNTIVNTVRGGGPDIEKLSRMWPTKLAFRMRAKGVTL